MSNQTNDMETKDYSIKTPISSIKADVKELEISVVYRKGGYNPFHSTNEERGIFVMVRPLHQSVINGIIFNSIQIGGDTAQCGFKVFVKALNRKSDKQMENVFNKVNDTDLIKSITDLYMQREFRSIVHLLIERTK